MIGEPSAKEVLSIKHSSERVPANALFLSFGAAGTESAYIISEYLFDFRRRMVERGLDPLLPVVVGKKDLYEINQIALFDKSRMVATLDKEMTKMYSIITNQAEKASIFVRDESVGYLLAAMDDIRFNHELVMREGKPVLMVTGSMSGLLEESETQVDARKLPEYEKLLVEDTQKNIQDLIKTLQDNKVDPLGFGLNYRAKYAGYDHEEWMDRYPQADIEIDIKVKLIGIGLVQ